MSADPRRADDVRAAGRWLADRLVRGGARVGLVGDPRRPTVVGDFAGPHAGSPVALVYGHYDVAPVGTGWRTPPFEPRLVDGRLVGRGTSDDKGQLLAHLVGVEAWASTGGLPLRVVVMADGSEEVGSPGLLPTLRRVATAVRPDLVVVSDTRRLSARVPAVTVSQRGLVSAELRVDVGGGPVHAGRRGGAVVDPGLELARVLLMLERELARRVAAAPARTDTVALADARLRRELVPRATHAQDLDERSTRRLSFHVLSLRSGGAAAAVPTTATARIDVRVPPGTDASEVAALARRLVNNRCANGVQMSLVVSAAQTGVDLRPDPRTLAAVDAACLDGFGARAARVRSGGSLPAAAHLREAFGVDPVLLGLGPPEDGAHGPGEHLDLAGWRRGIVACTALLGHCVGPLPRPSALGQDGSALRHVSRREGAHRRHGSSLPSSSADRIAHVPSGGTS